jgi:hypothetical protein
MTQDKVMYDYKVCKDYLLTVYYYVMIENIDWGYSSGILTATYGVQT